MRTITAMNMSNIWSGPLGLAQCCHAALCCTQVMLVCRRTLRVLALACDTLRCLGPLNLPTVVNHACTTAWCMQWAACT
jgi:hypothetical protein